VASTECVMATPTKFDNRVELLRSAQPDSWIALSDDESRIVATGATFLDADSSAKETGETNYVLMRIPDEWLSRALLPTQ